MTQPPNGPHNPHFQSFQNPDPQGAVPHQPAGQFQSGQQPYVQPPYIQVPPGQQVYGRQPYGQVVYGPSYVLPAGARPEGTTDPRDLTLPLYGANMGQAIIRFFRNYVNFSGRASRSEFWWVVLFNFVINVGLGLAVAAIAVYSVHVTHPSLYVLIGILVLYSFVLVLPMLALGTRRLHDANQPGLWLLMLLVPGVGGIIWLVVGLMSPNPLGVQYDHR